MDWSDDGIVLSVRKHGESGAVVHLLTVEHGRHAGLVRGGNSTRQRGVLQPGNAVHATWRARLEEHLGNYAIELAEGHAARVMTDSGRLAAMSPALPCTYTLKAAARKGFNPCAMNAARIPASTSPVPPDASPGLPVRFSYTDP